MSEKHDWRMMGMNAECKRGVVGTKRRERLGESSSGGGGGAYSVLPTSPGSFAPFPITSLVPAFLDK